MTSRPIRVDPDVLAAIQERQAELQLDSERHISISKALADLLATERTDEELAADAAEAAQ